MKKGLFRSQRPQNAAGGTAYTLNDKLTLAKMAMVGYADDSAYSKAEDNITEMATLARKVPPKFLAQLAVFCREHGRIKDAPAILMVILRERDIYLHKDVFGRVINTPMMLRKYVTITRSGQFGQRGLGSSPIKSIRRLLERDWPESKLVNLKIGRDPSARDILRLVHPNPKNVRKPRADILSWLADGNIPSNASGILGQLAQFRKTGKNPPKGVDFRLFTGTKLSNEAWAELLGQMSFGQVMKNLNTLQRHGVFDDANSVERTVSIINNANCSVMPHDVLAACKNIAPIPKPIKKAAASLLTRMADSHPIKGRSMLVALDSSGSMLLKKSSKSSLCIYDIGSLFASMMRRSSGADVMLFDTSAKYVASEERRVYPFYKELEDQCMGGATDASAPIEKIIREQRVYDVIVMISDNESWAHGSSPVGKTFRNYRRAVNPKATLVAWDIALEPTSQVKDEDGIFIISGFSDDIYKMVVEYVTHGSIKPRSSFDGLVESVEGTKI